MFAIASAVWRVLMPLIEGPVAIAAKRRSTTVERTKDSILKDRWNKNSIPERNCRKNSTTSVTFQGRLATCGLFYCGVSIERCTCSVQIRFSSLNYCTWMAAPWTIFASGLNINVYSAENSILGTVEKKNYIHVCSDSCKIHLRFAWLLAASPTAFLRRSTIF